MAAFVPAVYQIDQPGVTQCRWLADRAGQYLTYLAAHLRRAGTRDLAWWQLCEAVPRWHRVLIFAVFGVFAGAFAGLIGLAADLAVAFAAAIMVGFIALRNDACQPTRTRLQILGRTRSIVTWFTAGVALGVASVFTAMLVVGLVAASTGQLAEAFTSQPTAGAAGWLVAGLGIGLMAGLLAVVVFGLEAPADAADVVSAAESLTQDRRNTIRKMVAVGLLSGLTVGVIGILTVGIVDGAGVGIALALAAGFGSVGPTSAWIYWLVLVRGWLPLTGRMPWRIQAFLTDAYQRGVLRQTGAVYQFRHARLQDHLADHASTAARHRERLM